MTKLVPYDLLRDRCVKSKNDLVLGRQYTFCHVPMDNPYTSGVKPHIYTKKIIALEFSSANERSRRDKNFPADVQAKFDRSDGLNEKHWVFRTEDTSLRHAGTYAHWDYVSTWIDHTYGALNFILDPIQLAENGIEILATTSAPFVISEQLCQERVYENDAFGFYV